MRAKAVPMIHLGVIIIYDELHPCFVRQTIFSRLQGKGKTNMLSAIQFEQGLNRGEMTYLAALIEMKPN